MERAAGGRARSATIADTMLPAAPVTTKTESDPSSRPSAVGQVGLDEGHGVPVVVVVADLDEAGVAQGLGDQHVGEAGGLAAGAEVDRLDEASGRSRLNALVMPTTPPPIGAVAPSAP